MKVLIWAILISNTFTLSASAEMRKGGHEGNGGDSISLEFTTMAREVLEEVKNKTEIFEEVSIQRFEEEIERTEVVTMEKTFIGDVEKDAINYPDQKLIQVSRTRWLGAKNDFKKALVFHEYLGIMRIDDSKYQISGRLNSNNSQDSLKMTILKTGNYRLLINDNQQCDLHVEVNVNVNKIFLTNISNQRSGLNCQNNRTTELSCKNDSCSTSGVKRLQIIDTNGFLLDSDKYIFVGNTEILPAKKFINSATYGFRNVAGQSATQSTRCSIFTSEGYYVFCDDKNYSELNHCPLAQKIGEKFIIEKCKSQTGKTCRISNPGTQKIIKSWSEGIYNSYYQIYRFSTVNLYCRIEGIVAVPVK